MYLSIYVWQAASRVLVAAQRFGVAVSSITWHTMWRYRVWLPAAFYMLLVHQVCYPGLRIVVALFELSHAAFLSPSSPRDAQIIRYLLKCSVHIKISTFSWQQGKCKESPDTSATPWQAASWQRKYKLKCRKCNLEWFIKHIGDISLLIYIVLNDSEYSTLKSNDGLYMICILLSVSQSYSHER